MQYALRFGFASLTYVLSGLFVQGMIRNREMALEHVAQLTREKRLRNEAQERLQVLVESSPAAIITLSHQGTVIRVQPGGKRYVRQWTRVTHSKGAPSRPTCRY